MNFNASSFDLDPLKSVPHILENQRKKKTVSYKEKGLSSLDIEAPCLQEGKNPSSKVINCEGHHSANLGQEVMTATHPDSSSVQGSAKGRRRYLLAAILLRGTKEDT